MGCVTSHLIRMPRDASSTAHRRGGALSGLRASERACRRPLRPQETGGLTASRGIVETGEREGNALSRHAGQEAAPSPPQQRLVGCAPRSSTGVFASCCISTARSLSGSRPHGNFLEICLRPRRAAGSVRLNPKAIGLADPGSLLFAHAPRETPPVVATICLNVENSLNASRPEWDLRQGSGK